MSTLRLGVIGATGFADRIAIPEFLQSPKVRIIAVQGRDAKRTQATADRHDIPTWTTDVDELLSLSELDAVYIASPVYQHAEQTIAAARAGKHVLCEKPMALNAGECRAMIAACRTADVVLMPAFMMRFNQAHAEMGSLIDSGAIGTVVSLRAQFGFWYPDNPDAWRQVKSLAGSGALADVGSHCIDLLRFLAGEITEVSCQAPTLKFEYDVDDVCVLLLRFASGAAGLVDVYFNSRSVENRLEVVGTEGTLLSEGTIGARTHSRFRLRRRHSVEQFELPHISPYLLEIEHFARAVAAGGFSGRDAVVDFQDGLRCQEIIDAALEAYRTGTTVRL